MCQASPLEVTVLYRIENAYTTSKWQRNVSMAYNTNRKYFKMLGHVLALLVEYGLR